ncbi:MAG TPA: hypothetical protein DEB17_09915 [Chlorobaculum sp.]|uniref:Uncharacterized protein n=1 Tax=Chlorobaculum tepidum (strain ATCC 49652 / DSM 12025 / NBRC 103806 / TLS) TaxID=194439 RepID=Q8KGE3_CHLTE|nr:hypothetical protein CT0025 [Chlorobaculum tepidum TLS]HBU24282.1 hypothetical protein [Chlorobaculum sp.]
MPRRIKPCYLELLLEIGNFSHSAQLYRYIYLRKIYLRKHPFSRI